jgi:hypothetical protein
MKAILDDGLGADDVEGVINENFTSVENKAIADFDFLETEASRHNSENIDLRNYFPNSGEDDFTVGNIFNTANLTKTIIDAPSDSPIGIEKAINLAWIGGSAGKSVGRINTPDLSYSKAIWSFWTDTKFSFRPWVGGYIHFILNSDNYQVGFKREINHATGNLIAKVDAKVGNYYHVTLTVEPIEEASKNDLSLLFDDTTDDFLDTDGNANLINFCLFIDPAIDNIQPWRVYRKFKANNSDAITQGIADVIVQDAKTLGLKDSFTPDRSFYLNDGDVGFAAGLSVAGSFPTRRIVDAPSDAPLIVDKTIEVLWNDSAANHQIGNAQDIGVTYEKIVYTWWTKKEFTYDIFAAAAFVTVVAEADYANMFDADGLFIGYQKTINSSAGLIICKVEFFKNDYYHIQIEFSPIVAYNRTNIMCNGSFMSTAGSAYFIGYAVLLDPINPSINPYTVYQKNQSNDWFKRVQKAASKVAATSQNTIALIEEYTYGANIQNFLRKTRGFKSGRLISKAPKIVFLGDSIITDLVTGPAAKLKTFINAEFGIPLNNMPIHAYGGTGYEYMIPFIEDILIQNNPDLVVLWEYDDTDLPNPDERFAIMETVIQMIKENTTADIMLTTWSAYQAMADLAYAGSDYSEDASYEKLNHIVDLARWYNCELVDIRQAVLDYVFDNQVNPDTLEFVHMFSLYGTVFLDECKKHFLKYDWQRNASMPNPNEGKEDLIFMKANYQYERYNAGKVAFSDKAAASWVSDALQIGAGDYIDVDLKNSIGVELYGVEQVGVLGVQIKAEGGAFVAPSTLSKNGYPLQYATEIQSTTFNTFGVWRLKRPFKKAVVNSNILANGTLLSGQYKIVVTHIGAILAVDTGSNWVEIAGDLSDHIASPLALRIGGSTGNDGLYTVSTAVYQGGTQRTRITFTTSVANATADGFLVQGGSQQLVTCEIRDPASSVLATIHVGFDSASVLSGALEFPLEYNGQRNFAITGAAQDAWGQVADGNFSVNETYEFFIVNNWHDSINMNTNSYFRLFGYEAGNYTLRLTSTSGTTALRVVNNLKRI